LAEAGDHAQLAAIADLATGDVADPIRGESKQLPAGSSHFTPEQRRDARRQVRCGVAVKKCPDRIPEPGCGCSGRAICARDGASKSRAECYECVEAAGLVEMG
jgi:hypothetical protein